MRYPTTATLTITTKNEKGRKIGTYYINCLTIETLEGIAREIGSVLDELRTAEETGEQPDPRYAPPQLFQPRPATEEDLRMIAELTARKKNEEPKE